MIAFREDHGDFTLQSLRRNIWNCSPRAMKCKSTLSIPQSPGSNDDAFHRCSIAMIISRRKFEFGVWLLYIRSRDSREDFNKHLGYSQNLKYQRDVSILAKKRLVVSSMESSSCSGRLLF